MDKIQEIWATVKQLVTSRTIWGVVVMLVGGLGIQLPGDLGDMIGSAGDQLMMAIGSILAIVGYIDRRPKPGMVEVKAPAAK